MGLGRTWGQEKGPGTRFRVHLKAGVRAGCVSGMGRGHGASVSDRHNNEELGTPDKGPSKRAAWEAHPRDCAVSAWGPG